MSSIVDVWGTPFPKTYPTMASKYGNKDEEKEGRTYSSPEKRHNAAVLKHRKIVDGLSNSLPIAESDEEIESNYMPVRLTQGSENMSTRYSNNYVPIHDLPSANQKYIPQQPISNQPERGPQFVQKITRPPTLRSRAVTRDMVLYIFTGVFFLFTLDTFVMLGRSLH